MSKPLHYLKLDRTISWEGWITNAIGPFDTMADAEAFYKKHIGTFNLKRVDSVTCCCMVQP